MKSFLSCCFCNFIIIIAVIFTLFTDNTFAADGRKWDGKKYPFKLLNPAKPNSETNPFIIDTAGKLAYFGELANTKKDTRNLRKK